MPVKLGKIRRPWYSKPKGHNEMTIHLPPDVERDILAEMHSRHFASVRTHGKDMHRAWGYAYMIDRIRQHGPQRKPFSIC